MKLARRVLWDRYGRGVCFAYIARSLALPFLVNTGGFPRRHSIFSTVRVEFPAHVDPAWFGGRLWFS
jgi:hypothetical protein